jgi:MarR family transcriptional regulator, organic hydroperoxide resistance regulator
MDMDISSGIMGMVYEMKKKCNHVDQRLMDELCLSQSEYLFFSSLDNCQVISSNELSKHMDLSASRVSRVVDRLVNNGYLDRNTDASDRRAITLCLTPKGKEIKSTIDQERLKCEEQLLRVIPNEEVEKLRQIIGKIIEAI